MENFSDTANLGFHEYSFYVLHVSIKIYFKTLKGNGQFNTHYYENKFFFSETAA